MRNGRDFAGFPWITQMFMWRNAYHYLKNASQTIAIQKNDEIKLVT